MRDASRDVAKPRQGDAAVAGEQGGAGCGVWRARAGGAASGRPGCRLSRVVAAPASPRARGQVPRLGSAGKMATPGMSWQHYSYGGSSSGPAKFTTSPAAAQLAGHNMDYSQDMHLKMSKKIAQLTKVWGVRDMGFRKGLLREATARVASWPRQTWVERWPPNLS